MQKVAYLASTKTLRLTQIQREGFEHVLKIIIYIARNAHMVTLGRVYKQYRQIPQ